MRCSTVRRWRSSAAGTQRRRATANAREFAKALAAANLTIVSGLALGIDAAAHEGALGTDASTLAVIGTGPIAFIRQATASSRGASRRRGGILSEFVPGTPARKENFPRRNRLISGLARGVLVVEATLSSGSLITARWAGEQGREVFAIPGSIHSPFAKGCHKLIREGAKLVETAQDVLDELGIGAHRVRVRVARNETQCANTRIRVACDDGPRSGRRSTRWSSGRARRPTRSQPGWYDWSSTRSFAHCPAATGSGSSIARFGNPSSARVLCHAFC